MSEIHNKLIETLAARDKLSTEDLELIQSLPFRPAQYKRGAEIIAEDSEVYESCIVVSGWAGRAVYLENGKRQISAIHIAGDFVDLHSFTLKYMDHSVVALTPLGVAFVAHDEIRRITERSPHLTRLFWMLTTIDGAIQRTTIASLGRRPALARLCHLLCELYHRLAAVGLAGPDYTLDIPLTQEELADILGLSSVHMNRTLQDVRHGGLVTWTGSHVVLQDFAELSRLSGFDGRYLNLARRPR